MNDMRAAQFQKYGSPDVLRVITAPRPQPTKDQILVRVHATTIHPHDTMVRSGRLKIMTGNRFPKGTGLDFAGEIVAVGSGVAGYKIGDKVWGILSATVGATAAAADFVAVNADQVSLSPPNLDFIDAAALSGVGVVTLITLRDKARLKSGERLLVRGASGGVGSIAVQFGREVGAHVTALAGLNNLDFVKSLGADEAFDYAKAKPSDLGAFDVVLDLVGTGLAPYRHLLTSNGRMVCLAPGSAASLIYILLSSVFGSKRVRFFSCAPKHETFADLAVYAERSALKPVVHQVFPLEEIAAAHRSLEAGGGRGKRVVNIA